MSDPGDSTYDVVIVGAGIVGLATGLKLLRLSPDLRLALVEAADQVAAHQTSHNSGVVHAGLYYAPGSLKARLCRDGKEQLEQYAAERGIPIERVGKLVVALDEAERPRLEALAARADANGVPGLELLSQEALREREPHAAGIAALWSPTTAIIDFERVAQAFATDVRDLGGAIHLSRRVTSIATAGRDIVLATPHGPLLTRNLITCAGMQADRVARMTGYESAAQMVPFRGDYYVLREDARSLVRGLIYPLPDPRFPFLGVHFTRRIDGAVWAGPNAVLAFARNGYRRRDISLRDLAGTIRHPGFLRLAARHWRMGAGEMARDASKRLFHRRLQRYLPELRIDQLAPGPSGVRAMLVERNGALVDDFVFGGSGRVLHVLNAPSPAATAALAIGDQLAMRAMTQFGLDAASGSA
ncbi:MAG: L-2-hydroxyglutarate oxidase [Chloroflexota bacterium]